jgi:hypothetical protein
MFTFSFSIRNKAGYRGRAVKGMNCLRSLERWDRGFESHSKHECLCEFILCSCCSVCRQRPCDGLISSPRSPTDCVQIKKLKKAAKIHKGSRVIIELNDSDY